MTYIARCPRCNGFISTSMADAMTQSPDIFDDAFHSALGHYADGLAHLIEIHNRQQAYISVMWDQVMDLHNGSDRELVLTNLEKLIDALILTRSAV